MKQPDIFPETLLVEARDRQTFTTSLKVAEYFGKRHDTVLRTIAKLDCSDDYRLRNFAETVRYRKNPSRGKPIPTPVYEMTRDGFAFLAMGFTGKEAARWKEEFLNAFNQMEAQLHARTEREAGALYHLRPHWKTIGEGTRQGLSRIAICGLTGHRSPNTITANRRRMRTVGLH
ncbi:MAG: Rha family transcriptional regulator [Burkholderiaceae bacterium]|jgi:Rha family phage regulatory protein|nr:Rha family transcriptional regulator [Burkholderiaceae bacterium]